MPILYILLLLFTVPAAALTLQTPQGFQVTGKEKNIFLNDAGEEARSSLLHYSEMSEGIDRQFLTDPALWKLYQDGIRQVLAEKGIKKISFAAAKKIQVKSRNGLLFTVDFEETLQAPLSIRNYILLLDEGARTTLHLDFNGPRARADREWKQILTSLEASLK
jgi:hypothetical protein